MESLEKEKKGVINMDRSKGLVEQIKQTNIESKLTSSFNEEVIVDTSIACLKSTSRSSIYSLTLLGKQRSIPIILKVYSHAKYKNEVELAIYRQAQDYLADFLPAVYLNHQQGDETWVFMEFVQQVRGRTFFSPSHLDYIIPAVAQLHAHTYQVSQDPNHQLSSCNLPVYYSGIMAKERGKYSKKTVNFIEKSLQDKRLKSILAPHAGPLLTIYKKELFMFDELFHDGVALTHGDLHMQNICTHDVSKKEPWDIQFIDWESAKIGPVWFDMVVLVELLLGFRKDWQADADMIRKKCIDTYVREMNSHGITFQTDPLKLYKMAYLQRTLEKGLHTQLRRIFDGRKGELLPYHLEKISTWGKELGIYQA
ncbi:phosphotransferase [Pontibacillus yanchengensis]|uniref:Phosphotransferase n=3 Tax=Pontibacillus yanchengensis TaxID=462910 RepID=A0ACC7VHR7_9BACI|nr:phosphotransferase [Pontibacillus yanchengensis]MYL53665.1 phosphotransferase [Pontibacillus yanchengensis]